MGCSSLHFKGRLRHLISEALYDCTAVSMSLSVARGLRLLCRKEPLVRAAAIAAFCSRTTTAFEEVRALSEGEGGTQRAFAYFTLGSARMLYLSGACLGLLGFLASMQPAADVLALSTTEFDTAGVRTGSTVTLKWRGKPVFVRRRTEAEVAREAAVPLSVLRDPQTDRQRAPLSEWLVAVGVCSHLGCVPLPGAGDFGGFLCPCHGSHYDASGRVRKGTADSPALHSVTPGWSRPRPQQPRDPALRDAARRKTHPRRHRGDLHLSRHEC